LTTAVMPIVVDLCGETFWFRGNTKEWEVSGGDGESLAKRYVWWQWWSWCHLNASWRIFHYFGILSQIIESFYLYLMKKRNLNWNGSRWRSHSDSRSEKWGKGRECIRKGCRKFLRECHLEFEHCCWIFPFQTILLECQDMLVVIQSVADV
jgi:hypothetical protein